MRDRSKEKRTRFPRGTIAPSRQCKACARWYTPWYIEQRACSGPCGRVLAGNQRLEEKTARLLEIVRQRRLAKNRQIEADCREQWGALTPREVQLFNYAAKVGYKRGYSKGRSEQTSWRRQFGACVEPTKRMLKACAALKQERPA